MTSKNRKQYVHPVTVVTACGSDELMWWWSIPVGDPNTETPPGTAEGKGYTFDETYPFDVDYLNVSEYKDFAKWGAADHSKWPYNVVE